MVSAPVIAQSTNFTFDVLGRYTCNTWEEARESTNQSKNPDARPFDLIVLGGGSFGAVLATRLFNRDVTHAHRILVLEAGPLVLPEHVQNLPPSFGTPDKKNLGSVWGQPWESNSPKTWNTDFPGLAFCLGGRSLFWGGWSPYFIDSEISSPPWPANVRTDLMTNVLPAGAPTESYLDQAARQIGTDATNDFLFGPLHEVMRARLFAQLNARAAAAPGGADTLTGNRGALAAEDDLEAPLAVQSASPRAGFFGVNKFNGVHLLLRTARVAQDEAMASANGDLARANVFKRLMVVANAYVTRLERAGDRVARVFFKVGGGAEEWVEVPANGRVFLAMGTIENTRFARNTVPEKALIGRNLMAHLRSNLTFRIPRSAFAELDPAQEPDPERQRLLRELQVSALFVKGRHTHPVDNSVGHYHLQITASGVGQLGMKSEAELFKKIPNIEELDQFRDLTDPWIVVTVRGIGEMVGDRTSAEPQNRITTGLQDGNGVPRAKVRLETNWDSPTDPRATDHADPTRTKENDLWDAMDQASDEVAAIFAGGGAIQYLSRPNDASNAHWQPDPPGADERRDTLSSTHHEAGTLWMGEAQATSVTDEWGRLWELQNLYAVGPALLPTIGSPNPMLSGVALSRRTADHLIPAPAVPALEANFRHLFDGTERTFQRWRSAGASTAGHYFALRDATLVAQPSKDQAVFYYAAEQFGDFVLRLQFSLPGPVDQFGKAIGNSGVFVRFRQPHRRWADVNAQEARAMGNPAWVATATGFEVQIDEQGGPSYFEKHRTGAIYDVPTGQTINGVKEPKDQTYTPGSLLQAGIWHELEIAVVGNKYTVRLKPAGAAVYKEVSRFTVPAGKYVGRGLAPAADPTSGYIGVQAHTGQVAFRHIRINPQ